MKSSSVELAQSNANTSTKQGMVKIIARILKYMKPYWFISLIGALLILPSAYFNIKVVLIIKDITNAMSRKDMASVKQLFIVYIPFCLFLMLLMCIGVYIRNYSQNLAAKNLGADLFYRINRLPFRKIQDTHSGDLTERVNKDVEQAVGLIGGNVYGLIENSLVCVGAFLYLCTINITLSLILFCTGPIVFLAGRFFDSRIRKISKSIQDKGGEVRGVLQEFLQGMPVVRAYNMEEDFHSRFMENKNAQIAIMKKKTLLTVTMWRVVILTNSIATFVVIYFVALKTAQGKFEIGLALAFLFLMGRVQWPFVNLSNTWGNIQQSFGAAKRVLEILDMTPEDAECRVNGYEDKEKALEITQVNFTYKSKEEEEEKVLFKDLNISVKAGEVVAVVGPSGSGKTTLARLCCGLYVPDEGDIALFGKSVTNDIDGARSNVAYVPQSPYIFAGTIKENIAYGREGVSDEEIIEASKAANAHEFIEKMEKGYDTVVGERGTTLSGGQRQRVAIARAFVKKAPFIILDEATSALDNESENLVQQSMDRLMEGRTVLVIAHRLSTVRNADRILVMDDGNIVEEGTHEELMQLDGVYSNLYNIQFKN
jgi:ATP-binding cassette, subfamily B, bacterial